MLYYVLLNVRIENAHGYKIARGTIEWEEGNIVVLNTNEGAITCHRSQLHENYTSAMKMARILLCESYGEEV